MKWKVLLRPDAEDGGWVAECPALPGCFSQGATRGEALANIREAIQGVLLVLNERAAQRAASLDQVADVEV